MATITTDLICNLNQPVAATFLHGNLFSQDNAGNTINVHVMDNGEPATIGGTVSANVIRADGNTVAVSGSLSGNQCSVVLPQACYAVPGRVEIIIKLTQSTTITTIAAIVANVYRSTTDTVVDPGTIIPSIQALIEEIEDAVDSIPVDYSGLLATIAADYSSSKTYQVGQYAWQGGVLKRCIVPITTAETYTAAHWTNAVIGDDLSALKSALTAYTGVEEFTNWNKNHGVALNVSTGIDVTNPASTNSMDCAVIECSAGDEFVVTAKGSSTYRWYGFVDSQGNRLEVASSTSNLYENWYLIAPEDTAYLVVNANNSSSKAVYIGVPAPKRNQLNTTLAKNNNISFANSIKKYAGAEPIVFENQGFCYQLTDVGDDLTIKPNNATVAVKYPCSPGDVFAIKIKGSTGATKGYGFVNSSNVIIAVSAGNISTDMIVTAPANAAYFIINHRYSEMPTGFYAYKLPANGMSSIYDEINKTNEDIIYITGVKELEFVSGMYPTPAVGETADISAPVSQTGRVCCKAAIQPGETIEINIGTTSKSYRGYAFLDASFKVLKRALTAHYTGVHTLTAPATSAWVVVNTPSAWDDYYAVIKTKSHMSGDDEYPWSGLYVSLLGDSISALKDYIPSGNDPYYGKTSDPSNSGITEPSEMWWGQLISNLDGNPLIMDAWSGSCVTSGVYSGSDEEDTPEQKTAMSDISRCRNLHAYREATEDDDDKLLVVASDPGEGEVLLSSIRTSPFLDAYTPEAGDYVVRIDPDIVLVEGGTNDFTYIDNAENFGTYDGHTALPGIAVGEAVTSNFRSAYATMIARIHAEYPNALIICLSCCFCKRPYVGNIQTNRNGDSGKTMKDYNDAIRDIAELHQAAYVDAYMAGFNRWNYYNAFASDRSTSTTHPNKTGHKVMAENLTPKMREVCKGFTAWLRGDLT